MISFRNGNNNGANLKRSKIFRASFWSHGPAPEPRGLTQTLTGGAGGWYHGSSGQTGRTGHGRLSPLPAIHDISLGPCMTADSLRINIIPGNTCRWTNAGLILGQRRRRWANVDPALVQRLVFTVMDLGPALIQAPSQPARCSAKPKSGLLPLILCWRNVGTTSQTRARRYADMESMCCICRGIIMQLHVTS